MSEQENELARDISMQWPEDIWAMNAIERYMRARTAAEFCTMDESRYFIRALLPVPLIEDNDDFLWGIWCEVSREDHDRYVRAYAEGAIAEIGTIGGTLANDLPVYEGALGLKVEIDCVAQERPRVRVAQASFLKSEQEAGIDRMRHAEIDQILFGDDDADEDWEEIE